MKTKIIALFLAGLVSLPAVAGKYSVRFYQPGMVPEKLPASCADIKDASGTQTVYPDGTAESQTEVTCAKFANGSWQHLGRVYANKYTNNTLPHNVTFSEVYVVHESGYISAYSDHRYSNQNNYVSVNGVQLNVDHGKSSTYTFNTPGVYKVRYGNEGRVYGWQWTDDTGHFYANIYVR